MIRLLLADVRPLEDPAAYAELYGRASSVRKAAADSFRFGKDRRLSIGAAALLDISLGAAGLREKDMEYGFSANGKPYFLNAPWLHFSVSHSGTKVAAVFSDREVGCDIEEVADIDLTVAERFFHPEEYLAIMASGGPQERSREFFRYWTLKESYMKATGLGMSLPPQSFSVCPEAGTCTGGPDCGFSFFSPGSFAGYECAVCFRQPAGVPEVKRLDLNEYL